MKLDLRFVLKALVTSMPELTCISEINYVAEDSSVFYFSWEGERFRGELDPFSISHIAEKIEKTDSSVVLEHLVRQRMSEMSSSTGESDGENKGH